MLQLTGDVDNRDALIESLEEERDALKEELARERQGARKGAAAVAALRKELSPLYKSLQILFGHIDAIAPAASETTQTATMEPRVTAVWENWKSKLGIGPAKLIDALLLHGEMNTQQLSIATGYHRNTVPQYVSALNTAGLLHKNGGRFSLKKI